MEELSYTDENGDTVFTSQYYINRGTCCKSDCLHCPFGTTLKNTGLQFKAIDSIDSAQEIIDLNFKPSSNLLGAAFGEKKKTVITDSNKDKFLYILIKGIICGVAQKGLLQIKEVYLKERFQNQGLNKDTVSGFYDPV